MTSPIFDLDSLLAPVTPDQATGIDLRADPGSSTFYYDLRAKRKEARDREDLESQDDASVPPSTDAWRNVAEIAADTIATKSKDLQVAAWLSEAMVRLDGFGGLGDCFRLLRELIDNYWEGLYPYPDEDGIETRVKPITDLNGEGSDGVLIAPLRRVPLTQAQAGGEGPYAQWQCQRAADMRVGSGDVGGGDAKILLDNLRKAAAQSSDDFLHDLQQDLRQCQEEYDRLCASLDDRCGGDAPPSTRIRGALQDCSNALSLLFGDRLLMHNNTETAAEQDTDTDPSPNAGAEKPASTMVPSATGTLANREDAFRLLLELAAYFRRTEPHSPVSYLLEQAVRWGRLPLPELWGELIADEQTRAGLFKLSGIRPPEA